MVFEGAGTGGQELADNGASPNLGTPNPAGPVTTQTFTVKYSMTPDEIGQSVGFGWTPTADFTVSVHGLNPDKYTVNMTGTTTTLGANATTTFTVTAQPGPYSGVIQIDSLRKNGGGSEATATFRMNVGFPVPAGPAITAISPTSGSTAGGTSVTITGTGFTGATGVTIGGGAATGVTVVSDTSITCTTPAGSAGTASVIVTTPGGANAANALFTYVAPAPAAPTVTGISPNSGSTAGGTSVTITGTGFTGATGVTLGGAAATAVTVVGATSITCTTPAGSAGPASVVVTTPGGANGANTLFSYLAANVAPVAGPDAITRLNTAVLAKVPLSVLLANDSDTDLDPLSITAVGNATQTGPGTATVVIAGGFAVYTASAADAGNGSFDYTLSDGMGGHTVTGTVTVTETTVPGTGDGTPNALDIVPDGSDFVVTFIGVPGLSYEVQYTTDGGPPRLWQSFDPPAIYPAADNGVFLHTDLNPPGPLRFYRAVLAPVITTVRGDVK